MVVVSETSGISRNRCRCVGFGVIGVQKHGKVCNVLMFICFVLFNKRCCQLFDVVICRTFMIRLLAGRNEIANLICNLVGHGILWRGFYTLTRMYGHRRSLCIVVSVSTAYPQTLLPCFGLPISFSMFCDSEHYLSKCLEDNMDNHDDSNN